jgi:16S rRNA G966 N2-methylase RsmD
VLVTLQRCPAGIVFLDPPYNQPDEYTGALELLGEKPPALTIAQHSVHLKLKDEYGELRRTRLVKHGDNALSFYAAAGACPSFDRAGHGLPLEDDPRAG